MDRAEQSLRRLDGRMADLRAALLGGDLATLEALAPEIERLADGLPALAQADPGALVRLGEAARHNARLLAAAREGFAAVRARLPAPAAGAGAGAGAGAALSTYDAAGRRAPAAAAGPLALERRA